MNEPKPSPRPSAVQARGLTCPKCRCRHFEVLYTRATVGGTIRRRRACRNCGRRVTTTERLGA